MGGFLVLNEAWPPSFQSGQYRIGTHREALSPGLLDMDSGTCHPGNVVGPQTLNLRGRYSCPRGKRLKKGKNFALIPLDGGC